MNPTCATCIHWSGAKDSAAAICTLPRPNNGFAMTGRSVTCAAYKQLPVARLQSGNKTRPTIGREVMNYDNEQRELEKGTKQETGRQDSMAGGTEANRYAPAKPKGSGFREGGKGSPFSTDGEQRDEVCSSASGNQNDYTPDVSGDFNQLEPKGLIP